MSKQSQIVDRLSQVRGAIPVPSAMTRRGFLAAASASAAAMAAAGATAALAGEPPAGEGAPEGAPADAAAPDAAPADAAPAAGMTFSGNAGKTMGQVLGAGWLGDEPEMPEIAETFQTQIVVCGGGHAGSACARKAAELGADVIVIDKQSEGGFNYLGNDIGHLNSSWQMDIMGVPRYDESTFINEYQIYCAGRAQWGLVSQFAYRSGEAFDWFINTLTDEEKADIVCLNWPVAEGYNYNKGKLFTSYVGTPNFGGSVSLYEASTRARNASIEAGAQYMYETTAIRLVHNEDGTEVTGVIAQRADGSYIEIDADAVVLACGDIGSNKEMYDAICGENYGLGEYADCSSFSGRDGSGIAMAMRIGAKVEIATGGDMGSHASMLMTPMESTETIWLNKYGKRFCNEAYGGPLLSGCATAKQPGKIIYTIWDANWKDVLLDHIAGHLALKDWRDESIETIASYMEAAVGTGADGDDTSGKFLFCADTLEELCDYLGMEEGVKANALAEIAAWNEAAQNGVDKEFGRDPQLMWPIVEPPFYGFAGNKRAGGGSLVSTSGLLVTENQQVQGQGFEPIKGLYATGNTSGGRFPMGYNGIMNGVSIGMCLTLGMCLGEYLATADIDEPCTLGLGNAEPKQSDKGMGPGPMPGGDEGEGEPAGEGESPAGEGAPAEGEGAPEGEAPAGEDAPAEGEGAPEGEAPAQG